MKHLLSAADLSRPPEIDAIWELAEEMSEVQHREIKKLPTCAVAPW